MENSIRIVNLGDEWPFPAVTQTRHSEEEVWHETSERIANHLLCVLPPIYIPNGFFISEPADHDKRNVPIHTTVITIGERYFLRDLPRDSHAKPVQDLKNYLTGLEKPV